MRFVPDAALRFFRRARRPSSVQDPADMGTAFGLEATFEAGDPGDFRHSGGYDTLESQQKAANATPARTAGDTQLPWMHRRPE